MRPLHNKAMQVISIRQPPKSAPGSTVIIRRHVHGAKFVVNPTTTYWDILLNKLRWAAPPTYRDRGT